MGSVDCLFVVLNSGLVDSSLSLILPLRKLPRLIRDIKTKVGLAGTFPSCLNCSDIFMT